MMNSPFFLNSRHSSSMTLLLRNASWAWSLHVSMIFFSLQISWQIGAFVRIWMRIFLTCEVLKNPIKMKNLQDLMFTTKNSRRFMIIQDFKSWSSFANSDLLMQMIHIRLFQLPCLRWYDWHRAFWNGI